MDLVFDVSEEDAGTRLDVYLVSKLKLGSRAAIQRRIEAGEILRNGRPAKPAHKLQCGDRIDVVFREPAVTEAGTLEPWDYRLPVLYEDETLIAINKPAHFVVHPGAGRSRNTVVNALLTTHPEIRSVGHPLRPGIVHRLDKETSGILLVAKTQNAYYALTSLFKDRKIEKHYYALVYGKFPHKQGRIDKALGRDQKDRKKISVRAKKSRQAITLYHVLKNYEFGSFLDVRILTGRTHQIRVHFASEGHPIVGDSKYGGGNWNQIRDAELRDSLKRISFFGLHAFSLDFPHPLTQLPLHLEAPIPASWNLLNV